MGPFHKFRGISYLEDENVYPVREDTLFLINSLIDRIERKAGRIMDMGCGSGLLTLISASFGWEVLSVDINPYALGLTRKNLIMNSLDAQLLLSDLLSGIPRSRKGYFDIISFNPPYLPGINGSTVDENELSLSGGPKGYEISLKFIKEAPEFLSKGGRIFLLGYLDWKGIFEKTMSEELDLCGSPIIDGRKMEGERVCVFQFQKT